MHPIGQGVQRTHNTMVPPESSDRYDRLLLKWASPSTQLEEDCGQNEFSTVTHETETPTSKKHPDYVVFRLAQLAGKP